MPTRILFMLALFLVNAVAVSGQEPEERLPAPREVPPQDILPTPRALPGPTLLPPPPRDPPPRLGNRDYWQNFAPGWNGQYRWRVINSPSGAYYSQNGQPFYWTTVRPTIYRQMLVD